MLWVSARAEQKAKRLARRSKPGEQNEKARMNKYTVTVASFGNNPAKSFKNIKADSKQDACDKVAKKIGYHATQSVRQTS